MGYSADAQLFYGFIVIENGEEEWEEWEDLDARWTEALGVYCPEGSFTEETKETVWEPYWEERSKALEKAGIGFSFGGYEFGTRCVEITASTQSAYDYTASELDVDAITKADTKKWDKQLAKFIELMAIDADTVDIGWWLVPSYG